MPLVPVYAYPIASAVVFFLLGWFLFRFRNIRQHGQAQLTCDRLVADAKKQAADLMKSAELEAKEEFYQARQRFELETEGTRREARQRQESLDKRENNLEKKVAFIDSKESRLDKSDEDLRNRQQEVVKREDDLNRLHQEAKIKLEQVAGLSAEKAKQVLMENMVADARHAAAKSIQQVLEEKERTARREAIKILSLAVQRYASEHVAESAVSVVDLPNDEMKGRIIGREGRNIRAFELATGIDVIIDDTPGAVVVSGFDPVRREVARQSLEILIRDGRIIRDASRK